MRKVVMALSTVMMLCIPFLLAGCGDVKTNISGGGDDTDYGNANIPDDFDWSGFWDGYSGNTITVDPAVKHQVMQGFGAADAWVGQLVGGWWGEPVKQKIADFLFSQDVDSFGNPKGIGLSMWRVNLGAGSWEQGNSSQIGTSTWTSGRTTWDDTRRAECYLANVANAYDTAKVGTAGIEKSALSGIVYDWNKCVGMQYWMKEAKKRGVERLVATCFSPVVAWTISGSGVMSQMAPPQESGNLTTEGYSETTGFPAYLADVAEHFAQSAQNIIDNKGNTQSLRFDYISPVNEPQFWWGPTKQEGSSWYNANIAQLARNIDTAIRDNGRPDINENNTKILIPEAVNWMCLYSNPGMSGVNHPNANDQIKDFWGSGADNLKDVLSLAPVAAGHTYWSHGDDSSLVSIRSQLSTVANTYSVVPWNTEWCALGLGEGFAWGDGTSFMSKATWWDTAIFMAKLMWADITVGNEASWSFWTALDGEDTCKDFFSLIGVAPGVSSYDANVSEYFEKSGSVKPQANLWTLGNYSLFVRPGFTCIDAGAGNISGINTPAGLMVSAYQSPAGYKDYNSDKAVNRIVVVYVNFTNTNYPIAAKFADGRNPKNVLCFVTKQSNTNDLNDLGSKGMGLRRAATGDGGVYTVEKQSVLTVVYDF
ncbi:MAG: hypothetical protein FWF29_00495 [Treponema sp.]|nr:hypothetical protein [Treponema sp.]